MDFYDKEKAQRQAKESAHNMYDQHYSNAEQYDPNQYDRPQQLQGRGRDNY